MNLVPTIGFRAVYNRREVEKFTGLTACQVHEAVRAGRLKRRGSVQFPYLQADVNEFLTKLNAGKS